MQLNRIIIFFVATFLITQYLIFYKYNEHTVKATAVNTGVLIFALDGQEFDFHPHKSSNKNSLILSKYIYEGLTRIDEKGEIVPALAKKIEISPNKKIYTISLSNNYWSNGDILTAYDIERSIKEAIRHSEPLSIILEPIKGVSINNNKYIGIHALSHDSLMIELKRECPFFMELLSHPIFYPVHNRLTSSLAPSNGPFMVEDWVSEKQVLLKKNPFYHGKHTIDANSIVVISLDPKSILHEMNKNNIQMAALKQCDYIKYKTHKQKIFSIPDIDLVYLILIDPSTSPWNSLDHRTTLKNSLDLTSICSKNVLTPATHIFQINGDNNSYCRHIDFNHIRLSIVSDPGFPKNVLIEIYNQMQSKLKAEIEINSTHVQGTPTVLFKEYLYTANSKLALMESIAKDISLDKTLQNQIEAAKKTSSMNTYNKIISNLERELIDKCIVIPVSSVNTHLLLNA